MKPIEAKYFFFFFYFNLRSVVSKYVEIDRFFKGFVKDFIRNIYSNTANRIIRLYKASGDFYVEIDVFTGILPMTYRYLFANFLIIS